MSGVPVGNLLEERPWLLIVLTLVCAALYLPLGVAVGTGAAVYAHLKGKTLVRNILVALLTVPILLLTLLLPNA